MTGLSNLGITVNKNRGETPLFLFSITVLARSQYGIQLRDKNGDFCSKFEEPFLLYKF